MDNEGIRRGRRSEPFARIPQWILLAQISRSAKLLHAVLGMHANEERGDGRVWPGLTICAQIMGYQHRQSLSRFVKELQQVGAIDVEEEPTQSGTRRVYIVHETPPDGYEGHVALTAFHKARAVGPSVKGSGNPSGKGSKDGGRNRTVSGGGNQKVSGGRNRTVSRTRRTEQDEDNKTKGASSEGTHVMAHAGAHADQKDVLRGKHLIGLDPATLTQRVTSLWCSVVREAGGVLPTQDPGGWDLDGVPLDRGRHPVGTRLKAWAESGVARTVADFDKAIEQVRAHARDWATKHPEAA